MAERLGIQTGEELIAVIDVDETLYTNPPYTRFRSQQELEEAARILDVDLATVTAMITTKHEELRCTLDREVTRTETVCALGITSAAWDEVRYRTWQPEQWLSSDPGLCEAVRTFQLQTGMKVCFATNAPGEKGRKTLQVLGFSEDSFLYFCPENLGCLKPDFQFFSRIAEKLEVLPIQCLAIGDRQMSDIDPAIAAGFSCGFVVQGRDDFLGVLSTLTGRRES